MSGMPLSRRRLLAGTSATVAAGLVGGTPATLRAESLDELYAKAKTEKSLGLCRRAGD